MICSKINSCKMKTERVLLSCILIITTLIPLSSCTTAESSYVNSVKPGKESSVRVLKIILKNGVVINCKDKIVRIENNYDTGRDFIISTADTIGSGTVNWNEQRFPELAIQKIYIEEDNVDATKTVIVVSGVVIVSVLFLLVLGALGMVDIFKSSKNVFSGVSFK